MKALKFVTDVRSDADYADIPEQAIFEIDEKAAARIAALSRMVSASEAHKIEVFDASTVWLKEEAKSDEEADDPENQERVELDSLVVSNEEFWFAGYLKHTNVRIFTARAPYLSPSVSESVLTPPSSSGPSPADQLTPREHELLQLIAKGHTNAEIADMMNVSIKTVERHRTNLMTKLDARNIVELIRVAVRYRLIVLDD